MSMFELNGSDRNECRSAAPSTDTSVLSAVLRFLDAVETVGWRMLSGIRHFLTCTMWEWLWKQLISLSRIAVKTVRVLVVFVCWGAICFGPLLLCKNVSGLFVLMPLAWAGLTLSGSVWGALYVRHQLHPAKPGRLSLALRRIGRVCGWGGQKQTPVGVNHV